MSLRRFRLSLKATAFGTAPCHHLCLKGRGSAHGPRLALSGTGCVPHPRRGGPLAGEVELGARDGARAPKADDAWEKETRWFSKFQTLLICLFKSKYPKRVHSFEEHSSFH